MRINSNLREEATYDGLDAGEGLAIFFSQNAGASARYRFLVKAITNQGPYEVGEFYSSPPNATVLPGRLSRMIAGAVCPGAKSWAVEVSCIALEAISPETAEIILTSSRCCTSPIGVTRVAERYNYRTVTTAGNFTVLAGQRVTGIAAFGLTGGGTITIAGGATITVPAGVSVNLEPGAIIAPNAVIAFANVDAVIEYLESA